MKLLSCLVALFVGCVVPVRHYPLPTTSQPANIVAVPDLPDLCIAMCIGDPDVTEDEIAYVVSAIENDWPSVIVVPVTQQVYVLAATTQELPMLNATMLLMGTSADCECDAATTNCLGATWPKSAHSRVYSESIDGAIALGNVASHEVGHLLGVKHNNDPRSLMQADFTLAQLHDIDYSP